MSFHIGHREFERLVEEAIAGLPAEFLQMLENVAIVVEEEPDEEDLEEFDTDELLGIYRGIPLPERSWDSQPLLPDQVAIFRGPILRVCDSAADARREIRETVIHELGHYFGLSDEEMPF